MGLITRMLRSASSSSCRDDQPNQRTSSVATSRMTLLSTRMSANGRRLPLARQGHDLVGCQAGGRAASHRLDETTSSTSSTARLPQNDGIPTDAELDLGVRQNAD